MENLNYTQPTSESYDLESEYAMLCEKIDAAKGNPYHKDKQFVKLFKDYGLDISKFDGKQIEAICYGFVSDYPVDILIYADPQFNGNQMQQILAGMEEFFVNSGYNPENDEFPSDYNRRIPKWIYYYAKPGFTSSQMEHLNYSLSTGKDVISAYKSIQGLYNTPQMREIETGYLKRLDITQYNDPRFSSDQMKQIRLGLEEGLDVSKFAHPWIEPYYMEKIRQNMKKGLPFPEYFSYDIDARFNEDQQTIIINAFYAGADIRDCVMPNDSLTRMECIAVCKIYKLDPGQYKFNDFSDLQLLLIAEGLIDKLDVSYYANPMYTTYQMREIRLGLEQGINVSSYADPNIPSENMWTTRIDLTYNQTLEEYVEKNFNPEQKSQISLGLDSNVNVFSYLDHRFDAEQMNIIRLGLEAGVDVTAYANLKYDADVMKNILDSLLNNQGSFGVGILDSIDQKLVKMPFSLADLFSNNSSESNTYESTANSSDNLISNNSIPVQEMTSRDELFSKIERIPIELNQGNSTNFFGNPYETTNLFESSSETTNLFGNQNTTKNP